MREIDGDLAGMAQFERDLLSEPLSVFPMAMGSVRADKLCTGHSATTAIQVSARLCGWWRHSECGSAWRP